MSATRGASYKPLFVMASRLQSLRPILFVIFCCLLILQVIVCVGGARLGSDGRADFRQFYTAGYMVRSGHANQIYDYDTEKMFQDRVVGPGSSFPFNHLAYEALLFVPLSFLAYRTAYWVYFALNLALLALATWRFKPYLSGLKAFAPWMPYATFLCFLPVSLTLVLAQDSILLLTVMIAAFVALDRGHEIRSGMLLGLGIFKFQYLLPIALLFFMWRRWRVVSGLLVSGGAFAGLSIFIVGLSAIRALGQTLFVMSTSLSSYTERMKYGTFPDHMPNLRGLIYAIGQQFGATQGHVTVIVGLSSVLVIGLAAKMKPSFPLAITVAALLSYHCLMHDATLLIIPVGMVLAWSIPCGNVAATAVALTVFVLPAVIFRFFDGLYFLMALPILALMWTERLESSHPSGLSDSA
jgi:glycosyl transferase family 87